MKILDRVQPFALALLRLVVGVILIVHGKDKLFGGLEKHLTFVGSLGLPHWLGYLSAATEFFGGIMLVLGLAVRLVGLAVFIEMLVAVVKVHLKHGLTGQGGYEYPLTLAVIGFTLIFFGAGPISLDSLFFGGIHGKARR
jgi:putative oxidoreductase